MAIKDGQHDGREPHFLQLCDLERFHSQKDGSLTYEEKVVDRRMICSYVTPYDFNGALRFMRVLEKVPIIGANDWPLTGVSNSAVAVTMELDLWLIGVKLYVRQGKLGDKTTKIILEDADGRSLVAKYER